MKKCLSLFVVLIMLLSTMTTAFGTEEIILISPRPPQAPVDVQGTVYEEAVTALMISNVVSGYPDQTYRPGNTLTRAEACAFLVNYLNPTEEERNSAADSGFTDVSGWATTFVNYAVEQGIVSGYTDGTFRPSNQVNYQEMAAMTVNALGIKADELVGTWPDAYINKAKELGMYENISLTKKPADQANRGDVALMVYSLMKYKDKPAADGVAELLARSSQALADAKSMSYGMMMEMTLSLDGETASMRSDMNMDLILEPLAMHMKSETVEGEEIELVEYYYVTEGEELIMYMLMDQQWYKMSMGTLDGAATPSNPAEEIEVYLKAYDHLRIEGKDLINDRSATKIYCELSEEYVDDLLGQADVMDQVTGTMIEEESMMMQELMNSMKGFGYEMWIDDETGYLTKVSMDMSGLMGELLKDLEPLKIDTMRMELLVTNIDCVEDIQLPDAAKRAIDLNGYN
ncbi:MAG: S-layer homology domain-containing protein [Firmicutes bacterium]|nr:S-layer homology domain-containing protein [Bacillota bacterium]